MFKESQTNVNLNLNLTLTFLWAFPAQYNINLKAKFCLNSCPNKVITLLMGSLFSYQQRILQDVTIYFGHLTCPNNNQTTNGPTKPFIEGSSNLNVYFHNTSQGLSVPFTGLQSWVCKRFTNYQHIKHKNRAFHFT